MGFIHRKTSRKTAKLKSLLGLAVSRLAVARRPRLARKSIACGDVGQLLALGHLDRALHRAEQVIQEDNMLEAFNIIELYCKRLMEQAAQLDKPQECDDGIREAAAGLMFAAGWCGNLPELLVARTILADKFGSDFTATAKEGTGIVDPMLVWKLSGDATNMELKKVTKEIAAENNILLDFSELPEAIEDGYDSVPHHRELDQGTSCQDGMDDSSESDDDHPPPHRTNAFRLESSDENECGISNSDGSGGGLLKPKVVTASVRTRIWVRLKMQQFGWGQCPCVNSKIT